LKKVTIVLLTFNRADLLKRAITNALNQTYENFELLIADDCSTDNTKDLILSFNDKRIRYMKNEKNMGFFRNWQNAVKHVNSDFIIPLISDDDYLVYDKFIEESISYFLTDTNIDLVYANSATVCNNVILKDSGNLNQFNTGYQIAKSFDIYQQHLSLSSMIFKKKFLTLITNPNFNLDNTTISNDQVIIFDILLHANKVKFLDKVVYHWTKDEHFDSFSSKSCSNIYSSISSKISLVDKLTPYLTKKNIIRDFSEMFNRYFLNSFEESRMNYFISQNDVIFNKILNNNFKTKEIYIFGYGEVGQQLQRFFSSKSLTVKYFIYDYRTSENIITLQKFSKKQTDDVIVIIASYKLMHIHNIYKKLISIKKTNFQIIELL